MLNSSKAICHFYKSSRGCKFGTNCRYLHSLPQDFSIDTENSDGILSISKVKPSAQEDPIIYSEVDKSINQHEAVKVISLASKQNFTRKHLKVCQYFYKYGNCKFGDKCRFVHTENDQQVEPVEVFESGDIHGASATDVGKLHRQESLVNEKKDVNRKPRRKPVCQFYRAGHCKKGNDCKFRHVGKSDIIFGQDSRIAKEEEISPQADVESSSEAEKAVKSVTKLPPIGNIIRELKRSSATDEEVMALRSIEIQQIQKRFPKDKLTELPEVNEETVFQLSFSSTDPDWPYDVKVFELKIVFPKKYPLKPMTIDLPQEQNLPETVRRYVEISIQEWIEKKDKQNVQRDVIVMEFRPFLKWLDRNLEDIVTKGLKQLQREMMAKAAGLEFIPASQLKKEAVNIPADDGSDETGSDTEQEDRGFTVYKKDEVEEVYTGPGEFPENNDDEDEFEDPSSKKEVGVTETEVRGTEVRLRNLQLRESASTLVFQQIKVIIQCSRCHNRLDITTPPNQVNAVSCQKCNQSQLVNFRAAMVHQFSSVIGYLDLEGCTPFDLVMQDCHFKIGCIECSKETLVKGLPPGQLMEVSCHTCHKKMKTAADSAKFTELQSSAVDKGDVVNIPVMRIKKIPKDPRILLGSPLPDNGTCKHYRKSFRWFRFPCCGKCYPCDLCHEDKEDHEMTLANRMICGHCCKEQSFALEKPCVACHRLMTKSRSAFWEGGKGCRDKTKMSKDDAKKYTNTNKTLSRKAQEKTTKKKENK